MELIQCEWLIILVIHDFNDPEFGKIIEKVLQEFTREGSIEKNKILLIRSKMQVDKEKKVQFKTVFQSLEQESAIADDPLTFTFKEITEVDFQFGEKRSWERLLAWINKWYKSQRTILMTLSHGAGVGIKGDAVEAKGVGAGSSNASEFTIARASQQVIPESCLHPETLKYFVQGKGKANYIVADKYLVVTEPPDDFCKKLDLLWMSELADALKAGFGERKIDILMMSNCFMQSFETGWLLREQVKYLVAPETIFKAYGYSFSGLLHTLNHQPEIKTRELLKTIIPDFIKKMSDKSIEEKHLKMESVVITDLRYYDVLKFLFEKIADILQNCTDDQLKEIVRIRAAIQNSSDYPLNDRTKPESNPINYEYIDFKYFLSQISSLFQSDPSFKIYARLFIKISRQATLHLYIGDDYIRHDQFINRKFGLQGISIFMPRNKETNNLSKFINCAYFGTQQISVDTGPEIELDSFVKTSSWDEFIKKYIMHLSDTDSNQ